MVSQADRPSKDTPEHFGIELGESDALFDWRDRARAAGLEVRIEEQVTCCYAVADKWWATDPDGNDWEFWVRSADAEAMHGDVDGAMPMQTQKEGEGASTCCAPPAAASSLAGSPAASADDAPC